MVSYPFQFSKEGGVSRGRIPSIEASQLRAMLLEAHISPSKILATCCSDDGLGSRLVEDAGFPFVFLGGFMVSSSFGLPDTVSELYKSKDRGLS